MIKNLINRARIVSALLLITARLVNAEDLSPSQTPLSSGSSHIESEKHQLQTKLEEYHRQAREELKTYKASISQRKLAEVEKIMIRQLIISVPEITFETLSTEDLTSIMEGSTLIFYQPAQRISAAIEQNKWTLDSPVDTPLSTTSSKTIREDISRTTFLDESSAPLGFQITLGMIAKSEVFNKDQIDSLQRVKGSLTEHKNRITTAHIEAQKKFNQHYLFDDHLQTLNNLDPHKESLCIQKFALMIATQRQEHLRQTLKELISHKESNPSMDSNLETPENVEKLRLHLALKKEEADNQVKIMEGIEEKILFETLLINEIDRILTGFSE
jgi:hypothetical protein